MDYCIKHAEKYYQEKMGLSDDELIKIRQNEAYRSDILNRRSEFETDFVDIIRQVPSDPDPDLQNLHVNRLKQHYHRKMEDLKKKYESGTRTCVVS